MKATVDYIDLIYNLLKSSNKSGWKFKDLWNKIVNNLSQEQLKNKNKCIANIYSDMVLDNRFFLTEEGLWNLKENMPLGNLTNEQTATLEFNDTEKFNELIENEDSEFSS